jgi:hypothetical protein
MSDADQGGRMKKDTLPNPQWRVRPPGRGRVASARYSELKADS